MVGAIYSRFHDSFGYGCDGRRADFDQHGGGRRAGFYNQHGGGLRRDRHVHFDDEDDARGEYDDGFNDNENSFEHHGRFRQPHEHRCGAGHDGKIIMVVAIEMIQTALLASS